MNEYAERAGGVVQFVIYCTRQQRKRHHDTFANIDQDEILLQNYYTNIRNPTKKKRTTGV